MSNYSVQPWRFCHNNWLTWRRASVQIYGGWGVETWSICGMCLLLFIWTAFVALFCMHDFSSLVICFQKVIENGVGTKNNMVSVNQSDFEVFQALAKDSESINQTTQSKYPYAYFNQLPIFIKVITIYKLFYFIFFRWLLSRNSSKQTLGKSSWSPNSSSSSPSSYFK